MNEEVTEMYRTWVRRLQIEEEKKNPYRNLSKLNASEQIQMVHQHFQAMQYSLRRIVCSEEESHIQISTGQN